MKPADYIKDGVCRMCQAGSLISYNQNYALTEGDDEIRRSAASLEDDLPLRFGRLLRCKYCRAAWYLRPDTSEVCYINACGQKILLRWNEQAEPAGTKLRQALDQIGATPPDLYGNGAGRLVYPGKLTLKDGRTFDRCLVYEQPWPPLISANGESNESDEPGPPVFFSCDVADFKPSPFALSHENRMKTSQAPEIRMSYAPTLFRLPDGRQVFTNWTTNFAAGEGYTGSQLIFIEHGGANYDAPLAPGYDITEQAVVYILP